MKKGIVIGLMAVLAIYGCQVKEMSEQAPLREAKVFTATIEDDAFVETKTSLDNVGNVLWKMGDKVSIFAGSTINEQYQVTDASDGETAASLYLVSSPGFVAGTDIDNNVAFYPYAATVSIAKSESAAYILKKITLPSIQYYAEGSFGNGAFPMTAITSSTSDMRLKFKNILGGLKLQLKGTATIASISVTGNNDEILCGAAEVTVANGSVPSISLTDATAKTVTLNCGNGVQLNTATATPFIIALPAMTMEGGFTVIVTDTEGGQMEIKTTKSQTFNRSNLLKMPAVTYEGILPVAEHPLFIRYPSCLLRTCESITQEVWYGTCWEDRDYDNLPVITWTSSNDAVASPEGDNVIRANGPGSATIQGVDNTSGSTISFIVNVENATDKVYDDYLPGIALVNCHDNSARWSCTNGEYALTDGYAANVYTTNGPIVLDTQTQCMGATIYGYKIAEVFFNKRVNVSSIENPALFIRMYIDDVSKFITMSNGDPMVEIRSTDSVNEYQETNARVFWSLNDIFTNMDDATENAKQTLHSGWNNIVLPLDRANYNGFNADYNLTNLTYFRFFQMYQRGTVYNPDYEPTVFKFDQIRIIDWTEFDNCDNFAMWRDRPAQQNRYCYVDDTEGKVEGRSCIACKDVLMNAISSYRLEMWPGLEYAMPAMYNPEDLAFQCKLYLDDPEVFTQYWNFDFEIASEFTLDYNGFDVGFGPGGLPWPEGIVLQQGWNTIKFNFEDVMAYLRGEAWDPRKITYFRLIFTPINLPQAQVTYRTFKIDDIRIVRK